MIHMYDIAPRGEGLSQEWRFIYVLPGPHYLDFLAALACALPAVQRALLCNVHYHPSARSAFIPVPLTWEPVGRR